MVELNSKIIEACKKALRQNEGCAPEVVRKIMDELNDKSLLFTQMEVMKLASDLSTPLVRRQELEKLGNMISGYEPITPAFTTGQILTLSGAIEAYKRNFQNAALVDLNEYGRQAQEQLPEVQDQEREGDLEAAKRLEERNKAKIAEAVKLLRQLKV